MLRGDKTAPSTLWSSPSLHRRQHKCLTQQVKATLCLNSNSLREQEGWLVVRYQANLDIPSLTSLVQCAVCISNMRQLQLLPTSPFDILLSHCNIDW